MNAPAAIPAERLERARQIADAVLFEGYILYPYRPSSTKNRQRWTFGGVCPEAYCAAHPGSEVSGTQTECLVRGGPGTAVQARLRFLHLCRRQVAERWDGWPAERGSALPAGFRPVESLRVAGRRYATWQEAVEREVDLPGMDLAALAARPERLDFAFPAADEIEWLRDSSGAVLGLILRRQEAIAGAVDVAAEPHDDVFKLTVRIANRTAMTGGAGVTRDEAMLQSFVSTHTVLYAGAGEFLSSIDPPGEYRALAATCRNEGTYPVLAGEEGERDLMISSPIILYDHPQIAPESAGDLFDGTEIDEILSLRILTLTDEEKEEAREADPRACELLDRTESLPPEALMRLHGALRTLRPSRREAS